MSIQSKLKEAQKNWKTAKENYAEGGFYKPPPGIYIAKLTKAELKESNNGNFGIARSHTILEGDEEGKVVGDWMNLGNETGLSFVIQWIEIMGYASPDAIDDLDEIVNKIGSEQATVKMQAIKSGEYINIRVQELLAVDADAADPDPDPDPDPDSADADLEKKLLEFCIACGIDVSAEDSVDLLKEKLGEFEIEESDLDEGEAELLKAFNLENVIKKPAKKKATQKKKK